MDERLIDERPTGGDDDAVVSRTRLVRGALRQVGRHERAFEACLTELSGTGDPSLSLTTVAFRRARLHVDRASGLAAMAIRVNRDVAALPFLAAAVERQERNALRLAERCTAAASGALTPHAS